LVSVDIGPPELIIVLVIVLLVFGAKKLPEIGRGLGRGIREFRGGLTEREEQGEALTGPGPKDADPRG
jgi:sec-independent protein translocase protein TatA